MTKPLMDLLRSSEKRTGANLLREMIGFAAERLMELEDVAIDAPLRCGLPTVAGVTRHHGRKAAVSSHATLRVARRGGADAVNAPADLVRKRPFRPRRTTMTDNEEKLSNPCAPISPGEQQYHACH